MTGHFRGEFRAHRAGHGQRGPRAQESASSGEIDASTSRTGAILAGLPAGVMDELVSDLAEGVVAILLSGAATEPGEGDDASGSL